MQAHPPYYFHMLYLKNNTAERARHHKAQNVYHRAHDERSYVIRIHELPEHPNKDARGGQQPQRDLRPHRSFRARVKKEDGAEQKAFGGIHGEGGKALGERYAARKQEQPRRGKHVQPAGEHRRI